MIWELIVKIATYPIQWFWAKYQECKENGNVKRMIGLWIISLTGVIAIGLSLFIVVGYLLTNHLNLLIAIACIWWLYVYVRDKFFPKPVKEEQIDKDLQSMRLQADRLYPTMRNIVFQTAKAFAPDVGAKSPRLLGEIEMPEEHYILSNNICYYQFRLVKADMSVVYTMDELREFKLIIQTTLAQKIQSGEFKTLQIERYRDKYANWLDAVILDTIEDVGNYFILQTVFCTPEYAEYLHQNQMNGQDCATNKSVPYEEWKDRP